MAAGFDDTTFMHRAYLQYVLSVIHWDNWALGAEHPFEIVPPERTPGGDRITLPIKYATTSNGGTYAYADPAPASDDDSNISAYWTKDPYWASARTYGVVNDWLQQGYNGSEVAENRDQEAANTAGLNLRANITSGCISDIEADIDSTTAFSDAALVRATYNITSYEDTSGGDISLAHMEDAFEILEDDDSTYGPPVEAKDCVVLLPRNQLTNLARVATANAGSSIKEAELHFVSSTEPGKEINPDRVHRIREWGMARIMVVTGMTDTVVLICHKDAVKIFQWRPFRVADKTAGVMGDQTYRLITGGANACVVNPVACAKLSGLNS